MRIDINYNFYVSLIVSNSCYSSMVSREDADECFKLLGFGSFIPMRNEDLVILVKKKEKELGSKITEHQKLLLINAIRCNNLCDFEDTPKVKHDKLQKAFDEVRAADKIHRSVTFPTEVCDLLLVKTPFKDSKDRYNYVAKPILIDSYWHKQLIKKGYLRCLIKDVKINPECIYLPQLAENNTSIHILTIKKNIKNPEHAVCKISLNVSDDILEDDFVIFQSDEWSEPNWSDWIFWTD